MLKNKSWTQLLVWFIIPLVFGLLIFSQRIVNQFLGFLRDGGYNFKCCPSIKLENATVFALIDGRPFCRAAFDFFCEICFFVKLLFGQFLPKKNGELSVFLNIFEIPHCLLCSMIFMTIFSKHLKKIRLLVACYHFSGSFWMAPNFLVADSFSWRSYLRNYLKAQVFCENKC